MDRLIYTAMTGAKHTMGQQAAVANNLANANSTGFRAAMHKTRAVPIQGEGLPTRAFAVDASISNNFESGPLQYTGRNYDVAVEGKGWLVVQGPDGREAYTRDGSLELSPNGILQTRRGYPVIGDGGPISIPPDSEVLIGKDGTMSSVSAGGSEAIINVLGQLKLVNPPEEGLVRGDDGLFRNRDGAPAVADENVQVAGGFVEGSNVSVVEQMVTMISLGRQFEMQIKMLQNAEANDRAATQVLAQR